jgi:hypothetical protein
LTFPGNNHNFLLKMSSLKNLIGDRRRFISQVMMLGGAVVILASLYLHESQGGVIFGRYSTSYAIVLAVLTCVLIGFFAAVICFSQPFDRVLVKLSFLPLSTLDLVVIGTSGAIGAVLLRGSRSFELFSDPLLIVGGCILFVGMVVGIYSAKRQVFPDELYKEIPVSLFGFLFLYSLIARPPGWLIIAGTSLVGTWWLYKIPPFGTVGMIDFWTRFSRSRLSDLFAIGLVGLWILLMYGPSVGGLKVGEDDVMYIRFVYVYGPLGNFVGHSVFPHVYRPLAAVSTWIYYTLFDLNMAAWRSTQLGVFTIGLGVLYIAFQRLSKNKLLGLLLTLLFASNLVINELMQWIVETTVLRVTLSGIVVILLQSPSDHILWLLSLLGVLFVAPFAKENSLALLAGVILYGTYGGWKRLLNRRLAVLVIIGTISMVAIYFLTRTLVVGGTTNADSIAGDGSMFSTYYTAEQVRGFPLMLRLGYHVYNAAAHLIASFFPVFDWTGGIWLGAIVTLGYLLILLAAIVSTGLMSGLRTDMASEPTTMPNGTAVALRGGALSVLAFTMPFVISRWQPTNAELMVALQGVLTVGIILTCLAKLGWTPQQLLMSVFALGLVIANGVLGFPFFRHRIRDFALLGWLILLAVTLQRLESSAAGKAFRSAMIILSVTLLFTSSLHVRATAIRGPNMVPLLEGSGKLCQPTFPETLAVRIVEEYGMDIEMLSACRKNLAP